MTEISLIFVSVSIILNALLLSSNIPLISKERKRKIVFDIAYSLAWEAQRVWGDGAGSIKKAHVKAKLYIVLAAMPLLRYAIVNEQYIDNIIAEAVAKMREYRGEDIGK